MGDRQGIPLIEIQLLLLLRLVRPFLSPHVDRRTTGALLPNFACHLSGDGGSLLRLGEMLLLATLVPEGFLRHAHGRLVGRGRLARRGRLALLAF